MKTYRLKKDLPTFKAGEVFELWDSIETQGLCRESDGVMAYHQKTLDKFPNILEEWFEEIKPKEPRINNDDARDAVYSWASSHQIFEVQCKKTAIGSGLEVVTFEAFKLVSAPRIAFASWCLDADVVNGEIYTIAELCGEDEE